MYPVKKALIIGISDYKDKPLIGPANDAKAIGNVLASHFNGDPNFDCKVIYSTEKDPEPITEGYLTREIRTHFKFQADVALFFFAGHGHIDELGGYMQTKDGEVDDPGVSFSTVLDYAINSPIPEIILIFDCCYSGDAGNTSKFGKKMSMLREGISVLTASRSNQYSVEKRGNGVFTTSICTALMGGAADLIGEVTIASIYSFVDQVLGPRAQRPLFKTHASRMIPIRKCEPKIPKDILRRIYTYFPYDAFKFQLDPSYEPSVEPRNRKHEAIFSELQKFRNLGLLEPEGEDHMYDAAMNSGRCILTSLGKLYWELVKAKRI